MAKKSESSAVKEIDRPSSSDTSGDVVETRSGDTPEPEQQASADSLDDTASEQSDVVKPQKSAVTVPKKSEDKKVEKEPQSPPMPLQETSENLSKIQIDPEFQELLSPLSDAEYVLLEKDILEHGCTTPLITDQHGNLLNGHHRHKINTEHGIPFSIRVIHFENREATKKWMLENQLGRRNLTDFQRAEIALKLKPIIAAQAKANQKAAGGALPEKSPKAVDTREEVAKLAGTSSNTMSKVEYILEHADEETMKKLRGGEPKTSINKVYKETKARNRSENASPNADSTATGVPGVAGSSASVDTKNNDSVDKDHVEALLSQVRKEYESFSKDEQSRLKEGLYIFLCDVDYIESEADESGEKPGNVDTEEEAEEELQEETEDDGDSDDSDMLEDGAGED